MKIYDVLFLISLQVLACFALEKSLIEVNTIATNSKGTYCLVHVNTTEDNPQRKLRCWGKPGPWLPRDTNETIGEPLSYLVTGSYTPVGYTIHANHTLAPALSLKNTGDIDLGVDGVGVAKLVSGSSFFCVLLTDRTTVKCFGNNGVGQLGRAPDQVELRALANIEPVALPKGKTVLDISAGFSHVCVVTAPVEIGNVYCWGSNLGGRSGHKQILVVDKDGKMFVDDDGKERYQHRDTIYTQSTWECDYNVEKTVAVDQLRYTETFDANATFTVTNTETYTSNGQTRTLSPYRAINRNTTQCTFNRTTVFDESALKTPIPLTFAATRVFAGLATTCAISTDGEAYCWGYLYSSVIDSVTKQAEDASSARKLPVALPVSQISVANHEVCALLASGEIDCFGGVTQAALKFAGDVIASRHAVFTEAGKPGVTGYRNNSEDVAESLGHPDFLKIPAKVPFESDSLPWRLQPSTNKHCALTKKGTMVCWGNLGAFRLTDDIATIPLPETDKSKAIASLAVNYGHNAVVLTSGEVRLFGRVPPDVGFATNSAQVQEREEYGIPEWNAKLHLDENFVKTAVETLPVCPDNKFGTDCTCTVEPPAPAVCRNGEILLLSPLESFEPLNVFANQTVTIQDGQYLDANVTFHVLDAEGDKAMLHVANQTNTLDFKTMKTIFEIKVTEARLLTAKKIFLVSGDVDASRAPEVVLLPPDDTPDLNCYNYNTEVIEDEDGIYVNVSRTDCDDFAVYILVGVLCCCCLIAVIVAAVVFARQRNNDNASDIMSLSNSSEMSSAIFDNNRSSSSQVQSVGIYGHADPNEKNPGGNYALAPGVDDVYGVIDHKDGGGEYIAANAPLDDDAGEPIYEKPGDMLGNQTQYIQMSDNDLTETSQYQRAPKPENIYGGAVVGGQYAAGPVLNDSDEDSSATVDPSGSSTTS